MAQRNGEPPSAFGSSPQRGERESRASGREANDDRPLVTGPSLGPIPYHWVAAIVVCVGTFLGVVDNSITNIALPTLSLEFNRSTDDVVWVALSFIVVSTGLSLTMGRVGDIYGRKMLYVVGFVVLTIATGLSAISGSLEELIGTRILQAIGSAMTMANGAAIITAAFPPSKRGTGLGLMVSTVGAGAMAGPALGGVLLDLIDWRAIFWTRVPFGVVGTLLAWRLLVDGSPDNRPRGLDIPGALLLFGMLGCLTFGINRGGSIGWTSPFMVTTFVLSALFLVGFIVVERRTASPIVDLGLFKGRGFSFGISAAILQFMGMSASLYLTPWLWQFGRGFTPIEIAAVMLPMPMAMMLWSPISGRLSDRFGSRPLTTAGMIMVCTALFLLSRTTADTSPIDFGLRMLLLGIGTSTFSTPNTSVIMSAVPPQRLGTASAAQTTARTIGNAIGAAVWVAIFVSIAGPVGEAVVEPGPVIDGFRTALLVAGIVTLPAILFSLVGGQRGVRAVAEKAADTAQVIREAIEVEISLVVPLFRGQKSRLHGDYAVRRENGMNGAGESRPLATTGKRDST
ncbi:MAG: MFS transporter [Chloroflexi bacterium]|nr:MFS transporter [Chloroflexota bacterium]MYF23008.1 MFS transporter [Chloroflexota bacterium]